jgi:uncharacterized glyoxalase superfamily protein PhnB
MIAASMTDNRTMPPATLFPVLVYPDVGAASDWLCGAFGFSERWRAGSHRALLEFRTGAVMLGEPQHQDGSEDRPPRHGESSHSLMVRVDDVQDHYERAKQHGAQIVRGPVDFPYGERQYTAEDIGGHRWTFSQSIADLAPEDWGGASPGPR